VQVPYSEGLAHHTDPESCVDDPRGRGEALTGVRVAPDLIRGAKMGCPGTPTPFMGRKATREGALSECPSGPAWSKTPACAYAPCTGTERSLGRPPALPVVRIGKARSRSR
jgi:hypothetical protein